MFEFQTVVKLTGMLRVFAVVLNVHLKFRSNSGLATISQETSTADILATEYTNCWSGEQAGESRYNVSGDVGTLIVKTDI